MIDHDALAALLGEHLPRQRWFAPDGDAGARVAATEVLAEPWPGLLHVSVEAAGGCWQVVLGLRPAGEHHGFLEGKPEAVVGELDTPAGPALAYDALVDPELALVLLRLAAPTVEAERARPITGLEQSNSSVVFDEAVILKLYRRLLDGPNPDAEVTRALAGAGFDGVAEPCGRWREADQDRAVANRFLSNGTDGFSLALTSLRDLFGSGGEPGDAGGDFAPDARRLGGITAAMHLALAKAFATKSGRPGRWADEAADSVAGVDLGGVDADVVRERLDALASVTDAGCSMRVHGDYHLGQVLRTDTGWFVLDFEGEPLRPLEARRRPTSPLKDVAGMLRSLHYATAVARRQRGTAPERRGADRTAEPEPEVDDLAAAWERHNAEAFLAGYLDVDGTADLLPRSGGAREAVQAAFELEKAVYEVAYERAHRPDWVEVPLAAIARLIAS